MFSAFRHVWLCRIPFFDIVIGIVIRSDVVENSVAENLVNGDHPLHEDEVRTVGIEGGESSVNLKECRSALKVLRSPIAWISYSITVKSFPLT